MDQQAIQDFYPEELSYCYGCGRQNEHGLHIKSMWEGDETIAVYTPQSYHIAIPGYVYGGLTASLIDVMERALPPLPHIGTPDDHRGPNQRFDLSLRRSTLTSCVRLR